MQNQSCTQSKVGHQIWVEAKCARREPPTPTCVDAVRKPHALEVVVTSLFVLLKRAALLVTPPTVSTLMGFSNCRKTKQKQKTPEHYEHHVSEQSRVLLYEMADIKVIIWHVFV